VAVRRPTLSGFSRMPSILESLSSRLSSGLVLASGGGAQVSKGGENTISSRVF